MTATNHILFGASIGLLVKEPLLALPIAFASHFILDVLPHFGFHTWRERQCHKALFGIVTGIDILFSMSIIVFLVVGRADWVVLVCALLAYLPDVAWDYRFLVVEKVGSQSPPPANKFNQFHSNIQKLESIKVGAVVEILFMLGSLAFILNQML